MKEEMRITPQEIDLLKSSFKGNDKLLKLMRKIFLPEITHDAPLGQNIDLWMTIPLQNLTSEEKIANLIARNNLIQHIESQLLQLRILAETDVKTLEEAREAAKRDSNK
jgi:hypothetical protein